MTLELARMMKRMVAIYCASYPNPPAEVTLDIDDTCDVVHGISSCRSGTGIMASAASCRSMCMTRPPAGLLRCCARARPQPARKRQGTSAGLSIRSAGIGRARASRSAVMVITASLRCWTGARPTALITSWGCPATPCSRAHRWDLWSDRRHCWRSCPDWWVPRCGKAGSGSCLRRLAR